jgi:hypothetical protein
LGRDDPDRLSDIHRLTTAKIASITSCTDPKASLTGDGRAYRDPVNTKTFQPVYPLFV